MNEEALEEYARKRYPRTFKNKPVIITEEENFYFMHGYHAKTSEGIKKSYTIFKGQKILSVLNKDNVYGIQFHPEKSHIPGKKILKNFYNL